MPISRTTTASAVTQMGRGVQRTGGNPHNQTQILLARASWTCTDKHLLMKAAVMTRTFCMRQNPSELQNPMRGRRVLTIPSAVMIPVRMMSPMDRSVGRMAPKRKVLTAMILLKQASFGRPGMLPMLTPLSKPMMFRTRMILCTTTVKSEPKKQVVSIILLQHETHTK